MDDALAQASADADSRGDVVRLRLEIADGFGDLPWETLRVPDGEALILRRGVEVCRVVPGLDDTVKLAIPGPLRILAVVAGPDAESGGGELLDSEAELARISDAVDTARRRHTALRAGAEQKPKAPIGPRGAPHDPR